MEKYFNDPYFWMYVGAIGSTIALILWAYDVSRKDEKNNKK